MASTTEESKQIGYPLSPAGPERVTVFSITDELDALGTPTFTKQTGVDWHLMYTTRSQMLDTASLDRVQSYLQLQALPDMLFGDSRLYLACPQHNFILSFSPLDCVRLCGFAAQRRRLTGGEEYSDS